MFQFTTTNVINSNKDLTTGKPLWSAQESKDGKPASFHVKRVHNFKSNNVVAIYKKRGYNAFPATAVFDFSKIPGGHRGDSWRLYICVGLTQGSADSRYSNDFAYKCKPFSIDFVVEDTAANTVAKLVKNINKYELLVYGSKMLNITGSGSMLKIQATDEYQKFLKINVDWFDKSANHGLGEYVTKKSLDDLTMKLNETDERYLPGREGFGTYSWLLHNLRIPTDMRTRAFGVNQDETPIVGALYDQYTIYYCTNRGILGDNAVGDLVRSQTTHVFYVKHDIADEFENGLSKLGDIIHTAGGHTPNPGTLQVAVEELVKTIDSHAKKLAVKADKSEIEDMQTKTEAAATYQTIAKANELYETKENINALKAQYTTTTDLEESYLKKTDAEDTYAKTAEVSETYETKQAALELAAQYTKSTELASTYIKQEDLRSHLTELKTALQGDV